MIVSFLTHEPKILSVTGKVQGKVVVLRQIYGVKAFPFFVFPKGV
jgi:hypothetical protein